MLCKGKTKAGTDCSRTVREGEYCFQHGPEKQKPTVNREIIGGFAIGDLSLFDSPTEMCCQPFVVAGLLLGVPIN